MGVKTLTNEYPQPGSCVIYRIPRRILALLQIRELLEDQDIDTDSQMLIEFLNYSTTAALLRKASIGIYMGTVRRHIARSSRPPYKHTKTMAYSWTSQWVHSRVKGSLLNQIIPALSGNYGEVPGWGKGDLVSAVTFAVLNTTIVTQDGKMTVNVSSVKEATSYMLYASYARRSYARACTASSENHQNILQNGSFAVDHFSVMGAKVTTSFLKEYIFIDRIKELMEETGNLVWEDSVEIPSYTYWTLSLPEIFKKQHGYAMTPYLMLLSGNEGYQTGNQGPIQFISDGNDQGAGFVADYRSTMTGLLMEYLEYLNKWTHETLGLKSSQQVGYNLPVDMLEAIPSVDIPETETLSFSNLIAGFRQFSGPANLAGKNVISIELGANFGQAYYQTWTELLQEAKHAFVAGVNQLVIHGETYSHTYDNTTWPGFTSFNY
ncbi:hypothetical protein AFLA_012274 [Aspergillus flavus NRRL3357]|nr:hypothetical protein AFLA_012274 [Aspergillus flavus NRRL3357]